MMDTITERTRRAILGARVTPAEIELSAADALVLAGELAKLDHDPANARGDHYARMILGTAKFMGVPVIVTGSAPSETAAALRREFGYVPDRHDGEQWIVYQNHTLIVIHPARRPRLYKRGCGGTYYEIEPDPR